MTSMKVNGIAFSHSIVISGEKLESSILDCCSKGHNLAFFFFPFFFLFSLPQYGQMNVSDRICFWRLQLSHKSDGFAAYITNWSLRYNLLLWQMFQILFDSSDNNAKHVNLLLSGYRTEDASKYKKFMTKLILSLLHIFSPVHSVYTSLNIEVTKNTVTEKMKHHLLHECGIYWAPVVREATQQCNINMQIPWISASWGLVILISFLNVCRTTRHH